MKNGCMKLFLRGITFSLVVGLILFTAGQGSAQTIVISIGTGGTGGIYYPYGVGVAEIWTLYAPGVKAVAKVTDGSVENVQLVHKGEAMIGTVMNDVAVAGYKGLSPFKGNQQNILAMAVMYPHMFQAVALKKSGITDIEQVRGRKISTGSPGSGTNFMAETVFKALGIPLDSYSDSRLSFAENVTALKEGTIEVGIWSVGPGASSIMDLARTHNIHIISFTEEQRKKILAANSEYSVVNLVGGVYRGVDDPVLTIGVWNVMVCQRLLDTEVVYNLVRVLYEHNDYLLKIHPTASYTTPENAVKHSSIPLHPGTIKYLTEKGIEVPANLRP